MYTLCGFFTNTDCVQIPELQYNRKVIPTAINIYETYHPGAVVRVLACNSDPQDKHKPGEVE